MRKRILWLLAIIILGGATAASLCSCNKNDDNPNDNQKKVAVLLPDASTIARWATDRANLETVMNQYGFDATFYVAPETEEGAVQQVEQLRDAINEME